MLRWWSWSLRDYTKRLETGCLTPVFRAKAALVEGSSASPRVKEDLEVLPHRLTARVTASRDNWRPDSFLKNWEWVCSSRKPRSNDPVCPEAEGESVARSGQESSAQGLPWEIPPRAFSLEGARSARIGSELLNRIVCAFSSALSASGRNVVGTRLGSVSPCLRTKYCRSRSAAANRSGPNEVCRGRKQGRRRCCRGLHSSNPSALAQSSNLFLNARESTASSSVS